MLRGEECLERGEGGVVAATRGCRSVRQTLNLKNSRRVMHRSEKKLIGSNYVLADFETHP